MKSLKRWLLPVVAVCSALVLTACGNSKDSSNKQTMNLSVNSDIASMDPSLASDTTSMQLLENTGEGFLQIGKNNKIEKELAQKIAVSKDGKTYTFTLRKDGKWSNGDPVTAQDFVYGWRRTVDPKTTSAYAYLYSGVENADDIIANKKKPETLGIKALGKYKVQVKLDHPIAYFKLLLAMPVFYPQNQNVVEKYGKKYGTNASRTVANGPFKIVGWNGTNSKWKLVKNTKYWDKKNVHLDAVNFQTVKSPSTGLNLYQTKKLDQTMLMGNQVANKKSSKDYVKTKTATSLYLQFNRSSPSSETLKKAFNNINIRKALSLSLNRKSLTGKVLTDGSDPAKGFVTANLAKNPKTGEDFASEAYVKEGVAYNKKLAQEYWKKGLKEIGQTGLNVKLLSDDDDTNKQTAEFVQSAWENNLPGMKVDINSVPKTIRISRSEKRNFDIVISGWGADFSDPITFLNLYQKGNSGDAGDYDNAAFNKLIDEINNNPSNDQQVRWNNMVKAEKLLLNDQATIPLYQKAYSYLRNPKVKGLIENSAGPAHNYKGVSISK
ncbi:oligopeptide ABC transporter substrate-binding protein [Ligilactobacillus salitolerans]|uniref:Oligopeptide ABC transporter substrate-binding protein n=1 Tax=Ligilactobacillus salitolerans TaxID=1808352 RepID=A0A401IR71_9LACO|nr:peptide ABC transporter substrate-binding protein [Ligilactobacillus salitolerans]GBG94039.1 oligopeptide ABC transporter substrate-binding protein [Ligilactobacillus salitolerans]